MRITKLLLFAVALLLPSIVHATSSGDSLAPTTVSGGTNWTNVNKDTINTSDNRDSRYSNTAQNPYYITGFGFSATPVGTFTVDSIKIFVEGMGNSATISRRQINFRLMKAGTPVGDSLTISLKNAADSSSWQYTAGLPLWGTTWSESELESSTFGIRMMDANTGTASSLDIDCVAIKVWFRDVTNKPQIIRVQMRD